MPEIPEKRQSVVPPARILVPSVLGLVVVLAVIWFAVAAAVTAGGEDCPATKNQTINSCR